jgi:preprotein translocase subunit SecA
MNEQRRVIYKYRREILEGKDMSESAKSELAGVIERLVENYTQGEVVEDWDLGGLETQLAQLLPASIDLRKETDLETLDREQLKEDLVAATLEIYGRREEELGAELMRELERAILLQIIDNRWREHLYEMDYLREGIHLRGFAQIDPLVAYKNEGFLMFEEMIHSLWEEYGRLIFHVEVEIAPAAQEAFSPVAAPRQMEYSGGTLEQPSALDIQEQTGGVATVTRDRMTGAPGMTVPPGPVPQGFGNGDGVVETKVKSDEEKIGRNDPCWCGSGKKYKKCHGA